jgi:hypothetical protein
MVQRLTAIDGPASEHPTCMRCTIVVAGKPKSPIMVSYAREPAECRLSGLSYDSALPGAVPLSRVAAERDERDPLFFALWFRAVE